MKELLAAYLKSTFGQRYRPGTHDCITFIARWADDLAGTDRLSEFRNTYTTKFQGLHKHLQGVSLPAAISSRLLADGWQELPSGEEPQIGDIVLTDLDQPGIWNGRTIVLQIVGAAGHAYLHRRHLRAAYRWPSPPSSLAINHQLPTIN